MSVCALSVVGVRVVPSLRVVESVCALSVVGVRVCPECSGCEGCTVTEGGGVSVCPECSGCEGCTVTDGGGVSVCPGRTGTVLSIQLIWRSAMGAHQLINYSLADGSESNAVAFHNGGERLNDN